MLAFTRNTSQEPASRSFIVAAIEDDTDSYLGNIVVSVAWHFSLINFDFLTDETFYFTAMK